MYCSKCGGQINNTLNYCNLCGAKLSREDEPGRPINPLSYLITALCIIGGGGLLLMIGLIGVLLDKNIDKKAFVAIVAFYLFALIFISSMIIRQISKLIDHQIAAKRTESEMPPAGLYAPNTAQLEAPRQPVTSVTDHTTRTLDEMLYKER